MKNIFLIMTLMSFCSILQAFDTVEYRQNLSSIENRIGAASAQVLELSILADEFNQKNIPFGQNLISKFTNNKNFIGAEVYALKETLVINQKIFRALIVLTEKNQEDLTQTAAKVVLLNQAQTFFKTFYHSNRQLRRILKASLKSIVLEDHAHEWRDELEYINDLSNNDKFFNSLDSIGNSGDESLFKLIADKKIDQKDLNFSNHVFVDSFFGAINGTVGYTNSFLTRMTGNKRLRNGHLHQNNKALELLRKTLRPMDIVMCSSPFVFAGMAVPGHYDHGAIYIGTKEQLVEIGMWNDPSIVPHQKEIMDGKVILDTTRNGVQLNDFEHFLYTDEVLVMRRDGELDDHVNVSAQLKIGVEQLGKKYNYTFDVLKLNKLLFTELIFLIYNTDEFPTRERMGHLTIYPSDIVEILFQKNTPFKMILDIAGTRQKDIELLSFETLPSRLKKFF
ncbi:MAG: hypothetical protein H7281_07030 [Bacteriovorax sp.]|nr:hypothetical protein [Bacteriovorax sp.]